MRKFIIAATLTLTATAFAQTGTTQPQGSQTQAAPAGQQQQKVIKDPTEYNQDSSWGYGRLEL
jgi:hypothetical protein